MKKDPDPNSTDPAEIEALITRLERGELREGDAQSLGQLLRELSVRRHNHEHSAAKAHGWISTFISLSEERESWKGRFRFVHAERSRR